MSSEKGGDVEISVLRCGTMKLRPRDAFINDKPLFAGRIELPVNAYLVRHPAHGNILIDTGWSADVKELLPKRLMNFYMPDIRPGETAAEQLKKMGIEPEDIDLVLLTHLDIDHTCALKDFAGRAKRIVCAELEYFYSCRTVFEMRQVAQTWLPYADMIERLYYRASVLGPEKRGFDIFGDDSVICVYCPGHTDGIFTCIVSTGPGNRFIDHGDGKYGGQFAIFSSDIAFSQRNIDTLTEPGYGFNREKQRLSLKFLAELQKDPMHRATFFSHSDEVTLHETAKSTGIYTYGIKQQD